MAPVRYWLMRTIRRNLPQSMIDHLLDHGWFIKPGMGSAQPKQMVTRYVEHLKAHNLSLLDKRVCVVGYGGGYGLALHLLEAGASHVVLQDPFAPIRRMRNQGIPVSLRQKYLRQIDGEMLPDPERVELVRAPLQAYAANNAQGSDVVVSNSVLEHVEQVATLVDACAQLSKADGINLHYIDLRDHYFRYPFEMLCYRESTWQRWLNAGNNLNRLRSRDFEKIFREHFAAVTTTVTERMPTEFAKVQSRILPEFLSGELEVDAVTQIRIEAQTPRC